MADTPEKKNHYHIVAGKVLFVDPSEDNKMGAVELNTVLVSDDGNVPARQIGKAQQSLQMMMFQRLEDPALKVIDVFIMNISYLGEMTEEEFSQAPQGTQAVEVDPTKVN